MTVDEVAEALRVSSMRVYRMVKSGHLPATRVGRKYRFHRDDIASYLEKQRVQPGPSS